MRRDCVTNSRIWRRIPRRSLVAAAASIVRIPREAHVVITLKVHERRQPRILREMIERGVETVVVRSNTTSQMKAYLEGVFDLTERVHSEQEALEEVRDGVERVLTHGDPVELAPQISPIRRQQHLLIEELGLGSASTGDGRKFCR